MAQLVKPVLGMLLQAAGWYDGTQAKSQRALSRSMGVSQETVRKMFRPIDPGNDERDYLDQTLRTLAEVTGVPLADILDAADADRRMASEGIVQSVPTDEAAIRRALERFPREARKRTLVWLAQMDE